MPVWRGAGLVPTRGGPGRRGRRRPGVGCY